MKRSTIYTILSIFFISLSLISCLKDDIVILQGTFIEWDAAAFNANITGRDYPLITRVPRGGEPVNNADPLINSNSGTIQFRINLVGAHRSTDTELSFVAVAGEAMPNANHDPAIVGTHYSTSGRVVIPANSSFGTAEIALASSTTNGRSVFLVLEIQGTSDIIPMEHQKRIGISIPQVAPITN